MARILLVEDDVDQAAMYKTALEAVGLSVVVAEDGEAGLVKAKSEQWDLAVLDIVMPKVSGDVVLRGIKSDLKLKDRRVVVFTNLEKKGFAEEMLAAGACAVWKKTDLVPSEFAKKVKQLVSI